jgi:hypothetical protein
MSNRIAVAREHGWTAGRNGHEYCAADYGDQELVDAYSAGYEAGYRASYLFRVESPSERLKRLRTIAARTLP